MLLNLQYYALWRVWRYQRVIKIRISKKNRQRNGQKKKDKQQSTKHTHKTKERVTRTTLQTEGKLRRPGRVSSSCSTNGIRCVNLVTNSVISHERGKNLEVFMTSGTYPRSFVTYIFHNGSVMSTTFLCPFEVAVLSVFQFTAFGYLLYIFKMVVKSVCGLKSLKRYTYSVISWSLVLLDEGIWSRRACSLRVIPFLLHFIDSIWPYNGEKCAIRLQTITNCHFDTS